MKRPALATLEVKNGGGKLEGKAIFRDAGEVISREGGSRLVTRPSFSEGEKETHRPPRLAGIVRWKGGLKRRLRGTSGETIAPQYPAPERDQARFGARGGLMQVSRSRARARFSRRKVGMGQRQDRVNSGVRLAQREVEGKNAEIQRD